VEPQYCHFLPNIYIYTNQEYIDVCYFLILSYAIGYLTPSTWQITQTHQNAMRDKQSKEKMNSLLKKYEFIDTLSRKSHDKHLKIKLSLFFARLRPTAAGRVKTTHNLYIFI